LSTRALGFCPSLPRLRTREECLPPPSDHAGPLELLSQCLLPWRALRREALRSPLESHRSGAFFCLGRRSPEGGFLFRVWRAFRPRSWFASSYCARLSCVCAGFGAWPCLFARTTSRGGGGSPSRLLPLGALDFPPSLFYCTLPRVECTSLGERVLVSHGEGREIQRPLCASHFLFFNANTLFFSLQVVQARSCPLFTDLLSSAKSLNRNTGALSSSLAEYCFLTVGYSRSVRRPYLFPFIGFLVLGADVQGASAQVPHSKLLVETSNQRARTATAGRSARLL